MKRPTFEYQGLDLVKEMVINFLCYHYPTSYTLHSIAKRINQGLDVVGDALLDLDADGLVGLSSVNGTIYFTVTRKGLKTQVVVNDIETKVVRRLITRLEALSRKSYKLYRDLSIVIARFNPILTGCEKRSLASVMNRLVGCCKYLDQHCDLRKKKASEMSEKEKFYNKNVTGARRSSDAAEVRQHNGRAPAGLCERDRLRAEAGVFARTPEPRAPRQAQGGRAAGEGPEAHGH